MIRYRVLHKTTRALAEVSADTFWQACLQLGYKQEECIGVRLSYKPWRPTKYYKVPTVSDLGD